MIAPLRAPGRLLWSDPPRRHDSPAGDKSKDPRLGHVPGPGVSQRGATRQGSGGSGRLSGRRPSEGQPDVICTVGG